MHTYLWNHNRREWNFFPVATDLPLYRFLTLSSPSLSCSLLLLPCVIRWLSPFSLNILHISSTTMDPLRNLYSGPRQRKAQRGRRAVPLMTCHDRSGYQVAMVTSVLKVKCHFNGFVAVIIFFAVVSSDEANRGMWVGVSQCVDRFAQALFHLFIGLRLNVCVCLSAVCLCTRQPVRQSDSLPIWLPTVA